MKFRRKMSALVLGIVAAATAAGILVYASAGGASRVPTIIPLAKSDIPAEAIDTISAGARADGVDPTTIQEVGGSGEGASRRAVLVGSASADGSTRISFFHGFGMTFFQSLDRLFSNGEQVAFSEAFVGPQGHPTEVTALGATKANVDHVAIELVNGTVVDAALASTRGLRFFVYTGSSPVSFPDVVRAYDASGTLIVGHEIPKT